MPAVAKATPNFYYIWVGRLRRTKYTTVTYLSDLKFQYSNGYLESNRTVDLNNLKNMLIDIIKDGEAPLDVEFYRNEVLCKLLQPYCHVLSNNPNNLTTIYKQFINYESVPVGGCLGALDLGCGDPTTETFFRKNPACIDEYNDGVVDVPFKGVILSVQEQVLHTSSVIWDALLGRGEALDCFNMKAQEAENQSDFIQNLAAMQSVEDSIQTTLNNDNFAAQQLLMGTQQMDVVTQQKTIIENAGVLPGTPADQAAIYKKVFGSCCPTPQYTGGCGCGNCNDTP